MNENSLNNYENQQDDIYSLCKKIILNYDLESLKILEQQLQSYDQMDTPHLNLLLYYIYFIFLDEESKKIFYNLTKIVMDNIILLEKNYNFYNNNLLDELCVDYKIESEEEKEILKLSLIGLHLYDFNIGISEAAFDYNNFHKIIKIIYSTDYNKIPEISYKALCMYVGTKMKNSLLISNFDKEILKLILINLTKNIFINYESKNQGTDLIQNLLEENERIELF